MLTASPGHALGHPTWSASANSGSTLEHGLFANRHPPWPSGRFSGRRCLGRLFASSLRSPRSGASAAAQRKCCGSALLPGSMAPRCLWARSLRVPLLLRVGVAAVYILESYPELAAHARSQHAQSPSCPTPRSSSPACFLGHTGVREAWRLGPRRPERKVADHSPLRRQSYAFPHALDEGPLGITALTPKRL
jgi:hypothetical protein